MGQVRTILHSLDVNYLYLSYDNPIDIEGD